MRPHKASLCFMLLLFSIESLGQDIDAFLSGQRVQIETYIMAGYEDSWAHCDVISADPQKNEARLSPQFVIDFKMLNKLDMNSILSASQCLLAVYHITSKEDLSEILQFGQTVFKYKRIALILKLENIVTLNMATDFAKLPFLIAAQLEGGREQFLCPIVGKPEPILQDFICNEIYASYRYKKLRVGLFGVNPHLFRKGNGIDGTDWRMMKLLAEKLKFEPDVKIARSFEHGANMVVEI